MGEDPVPEPGLKLHVGCGTVVVPGWENIDKSPNVLLSRVPPVKRALARLRVISAAHLESDFPREVVHANVLSGLPYAAASASFVYHSHVIEHMSRPDGLRLARECRRLLEPGGTLRVATPDLAGLVRTYTRGDIDADRFMRSLETFADPPGPRIQAALRRNFGSAYFHQWLYDEESITRLLREAGFADIVRRDFRTGDVPDLELLEYRPEGLFVEARAPGG